MGLDSDLCPHGVNKKKWGFDYPPLRSMRESVRLMYVQDAEACPDCLTERVRDLRQASELLLRVCGQVTPDKRHDYEQAIRLYYNDIRNHLGPEPRAAPLSPAQHQSQSLNSTDEDRNGR